MRNTGGVETYPNAPPPNYAAATRHPFHGEMVQRVGASGQPIAAPVPLSDAWRAHRELERDLALATTPTPARPALVQTLDAIERTIEADAEADFVCECGSPACQDDDHQLVPTAAPEPEEDAWGGESLERRARIVEWLLVHFDAKTGPRGWSVRTLANLLGVPYQTIHTTADRAAFRRSLMVPPPDPGNARREGGKHRPTELLERMVCAMARGPVVAKSLTRPPPAMPAALRMQTTAGVTSLVMRGPTGTLSQIAAWAAEQGVTVDAGLVRMHVRGSLRQLKAMREAVLSLERWLTLTPSAADVDAWIAEVA